MRIGDMLERALTRVGITKERVEAYLGRPCRCRERQRKLNELGQWARGLITGKTQPAEAEERLNVILGDEQPSSNGAAS